MWPDATIYSDRFTGLMEQFVQLVPARRQSKMEKIRFKFIANTTNARPVESILTI